METRFASNFKLASPLTWQGLVQLRQNFPGKVIMHAPHPNDGQDVTIALTSMHEPVEDPDLTGFVEIACPDRLDEQLIRFLQSIKMPYTKQSAEDYAQQRFKLPAGFNNWLAMQNGFWKLMVGDISASEISERKAYVEEWFRSE